jgi:hypothetical protein
MRKKNYCWRSMSHIKNFEFKRMVYQQKNKSSGKPIKKQQPLFQWK